MKCFADEGSNKLSLSGMCLRNSQDRDMSLLHSILYSVVEVCSAFCSFKLSLSLKEQNVPRMLSLKNRRYPSEGLYLAQGLIWYSVRICIHHFRHFFLA